MWSSSDRGKCRPGPVRCNMNTCTPQFSSRIACKSILHMCCIPSHTGLPPQPGPRLPSKLRGPPGCLSRLSRRLGTGWAGQAGQADLCCHAIPHSGSVGSSQLSRQGRQPWPRSGRISSPPSSTSSSAQTGTRNTFYGWNIWKKSCFRPAVLVPSVFAEKNDILWAFFCWLILIINHKCTHDGVWSYFLEFLLRLCAYSSRSSRATAKYLLKQQELRTQ